MVLGYNPIPSLMALRIRAWKPGATKEPFAPGLGEDPSPSQSVTLETNEL